MWTIDSPELDGNYSGFSERKVRFIKEILCIFQHFKFTRTDFVNTPPIGIITIDGIMINKPEYVFNITTHACKDGGYLNIQVAKKRDTYTIDSSDVKYLFGLYLEQKIGSNTLNHIAYHMGDPGSSISGDDDEL
jgi:hypothetical protein